LLSFNEYVIKEYRVAVDTNEYIFNVI